MTSVITVPASLDEHTFEQVLDQLAPLPPDAKILVDARHTRFATPYGFCALLCLAQSRTEKPDFAPPTDENVASYWARSSFYRYAEELYSMRGTVPRPRPTRESDVLLEVTPIARNEDVHAAVNHIAERATAILTTKLDLEPRSTGAFTMSLSEACQNIVEHAGRGGWVMVQRYDWTSRRAGRDVVQIAVADAGQGFRKSLESSRQRAIAGDRWNDGDALEHAVLKGVSRYADPGRGQGLTGIRGYVFRVDGKLSVRSGTARIAMVPAWDDAPPREDGLAPFPGAQLQITIPKRVRQP